MTENSLFMTDFQVLDNLTPSRIMLKIVQHGNKNNIKRRVVEADLMERVSEKSWGLHGSSHKQLDQLVVQWWLSLSLSPRTHAHVYATMHPIQANSKNKVIFFYIDALRHIITDICSLYSLAYRCGRINTIPFSYWQCAPGTVIQYSLPGKVTVTAKEKKKKKSQHPAWCIAEKPWNSQ